MRILIATTQVPFVRGGAELLAEGLHGALLSEGHEAEIVAIPFNWNQNNRILDHMLACRLLDLSQSVGRQVDRLIGLKFPAYLIPHHHKVLWLLHQHRAAYDLWDRPLGSSLIVDSNGAQIRDAIRNADMRLIAEAKRVFTISANVSRRLKEHCNIESTALLPPPLNRDLYYCGNSDDYFFVPSRISSVKRQAVVLEALAKTRFPVRVRFAGAPDQSEYFGAIECLARELAVDHRVEWLGQVSENEKVDQYANARGVVYTPIDEDFGYVTAEAMLASKPVITCTDSGGPLELVCHAETGLIAEPNAESLAGAMDDLWTDRRRAEQLGHNGREVYQRIAPTWPDIVQKLTQCD